MAHTSFCTYLAEHQNRRQVLHMILAKKTEKQ